MFFINRKKFKKIHTNIIGNADNRLLDSDYVVFDIETTGLDSKNDKIIQFAGIKVSNGEIIDSIEFFINPEIEIPHFITEINHISNEDVKDAVSIKQGLEKIVNFISNNFLIAHNGINFDMNFLNNKLVENKMRKISNPILDTMWLSKAININLDKHNLARLVKYYGINYDENKAHQALYDSELLLQVWLFLKEDLKKYKIKTLDQINKKFVELKSNIDISKIHY